MVGVLKILGYLLFGGGVFVAGYHYNKRLLDWLRFQSLGTRDYIVDRLKLMFIEQDPQRVLVALFVSSFGLGSLVFLAFLPRIFPGLPLAAIVTIIGWKVPKPIVDMMYRRRVKKFTLQMVDGLSLMSNGLKSGLSVVQSIGLVTQEMPEPIRQEFNLVLSENKLGVSLEEAFLNLSKRVESDDVEMFVTSVNILKETGGNLAETFDTIVLTIRERIKVEAKIDAMTAQGLMQGYFVLGVPPCLGVVFYQTDPDFMRPLFTEPLGWVILLVVAALEVVGVFVMRKVVQIEV